ncbi:hypothetical protein V8E53_002093 [Lactarius tabidus]
MLVFALTKQAVIGSLVGKKVHVRGLNPAHTIWIKMLQGKALEPERGSDGKGREREGGVMKGGGEGCWAVDGPETAAIKEAVRRGEEHEVGGGRRGVVGGGGRGGEVRAQVEEGGERGAKPWERRGGLRRQEVRGERKVAQGGRWEAGGGRGEGGGTRWERGEERGGEEAQGEREEEGRGCRGGRKRAGMRKGTREYISWSVNMKWSTQGGGRRHRGQHIKVACEGEGQRELERAQEGEPESQRGRLTPQNQPKHKTNQKNYIIFLIKVHFFGLLNEQQRTHIHSQQEYKGERHRRGGSGAAQPWWRRGWQAGPHMPQGGWWGTP